MLSPFSQWMWMPAFTGWGYSKDFPRVAARSFHQGFRHLEPLERQEPIPTRGEEHSAVAPEPEQATTERFAHELEALGGTVFRVAEAELHDQLIGFLRERDIRSVLAWDEVEGLDQARLREAGITISRDPDPLLKAGITGAVAAIAESGSLLLTSGPARPLSTSLLHEIHIAVVPSSCIVRSLEEALSLKEVPGASAAVLITGPSRTADIEMTLTIGVHGPKQLVVFVVE
jgi:L-lactate dehydrogenase complex protein LldG